MSQRSNGRAHAGCDIYVPEGTPVRAVAKGVIRSDLSHFYEGTASLVIDHYYFTVRYGELSFEPPIKSGVYANPISGEVEEGRILGYVKRTNYRIPMLHFEMYSGEGKGPLTVRSNKPTQRRHDLIDPLPGSSNGVKCRHAGQTQLLYRCSAKRDSAPRNCLISLLVHLLYDRGSGSFCTLAELCEPESN